MSIKAKVLAATATLTMVGGVSTVGTLAASAATPLTRPTSGFRRSRSAA